MKLSASQVSLILKRAAEIDARGESMTAEELERIASEAGIDPQATRTAIAEFVAEEVPPPVPVSQPGTVAPARTDGPAYPAPGRIVSGGAVGLVCGFLFALSEAGAVAGFGAAGLYLILRAVQAMRRGSLFDFELQNFTFWFGSLLFMTVGHGVEGVVVVLLGWLLTSVMGGLLVRFGPREEAPEEPGKEVPRLETGGR